MAADAAHQPTTSDRAPADPEADDTVLLLTAPPDLLHVFRAHVMPRLSLADMACLALSSKRMGALVWQEPPGTWHEVEVEDVGRQEYVLRLFRLAAPGVAADCSAEVGCEYDEPMTAVAVAQVLRSAAPHVRSLCLTEIDAASASDVLEAASAVAPGLDSLCISTQRCGPGGAPAWPRIKAVMTAASPRLACLDLCLADIPATFSELCTTVLDSGCCPGLRKLLFPELLTYDGGLEAGCAALRLLLRLLCALGPGLEVLHLPGGVDVTDGVLMLLMARFPRLYELECAHFAAPAPIPLAEWPAEVAQEAAARRMRPYELVQLTPEAVERMEVHAARAAAALAAGGGGQAADVLIANMREEDVCY